MNSTIAEMRVVVRITSRSTSSVKRRANATTKIEPNAPIDAASVGAATPPMIEPSTESTSASGGSATLNTRSHSSARGIASRSALGTGGIEFGRTMP